MYHPIHSHAGGDLETGSAGRSQDGTAGGGGMEEHEERLSGNRMLPV